MLVETGRLPTGLRNDLNLVIRSHECQDRLRMGLLVFESVSLLQLGADTKSKINQFAEVPCQNTLPSDDRNQGRFFLSGELGPVGVWTGNKGPSRCWELGSWAKESEPRCINELYL